MNTENFMTILAFSALLITIAGWFIAYFFGLKGYKKQRYIEMNLNSIKEATQYLIEIQMSEGNVLSQEDASKKLASIRTQFHFHGTLEQVEAMENFIASINRGNVEQANSALIALRVLIINDYRKILLLPPIPRNS